ncbi:MAG: SPFH domain-containing protein [Candidatus Diapherotrites archaeon]
MASESGIKKIIFIVLVLFVLMIIAAIIVNIQMISDNLLWIGLLAVFLFIFWKFDIILLLTEYERAVIFRFGKVNRVGGPGWAFMIPFIENHKHVDLRTHTLDVPKQDVITQDSIELRVDAIIYLKVSSDPQSVINSVIEVEDFRDAVKLYVISTIRDVMGGMTLSEIIANLPKLNAALKEKLILISRNWGVDIASVEIKDVDVPKIVMDAMHEQKAAVQEKLARLQKADAHKAEIEAVKDATENLSQNAINYYYIKALEEMSKGQSTKIFFPVELSNLAASMSDRIGTKGKESENFEKQIEPYKQLIEEFVDKAVEKSRKKQNLTQD